MECLNFEGLKNTTKITYLNYEILQNITIGRAIYQPSDKLLVFSIKFFKKGLKDEIASRVKMSVKKAKEQPYFVVCLREELDVLAKLWCLKLLTSSELKVRL